MKTWLVAALTVALAVGLAPTVAEAKRLGGGKSTGMQRDMPARTAPDAPPARPATPAQGTQAVPGNAAAPAAPAPKRSWMGPIAGLAAGLGIAALMSHLGMGEAFGNFLMLALLAMAALFLIRLLLRRFGPKASGAVRYAAAGPGTGATLSPVQVSWPQPAANPAPAASVPVEPAVAPPRRLPQAFVPAAFDSQGFERAAKMIFIRMQAAHDAADLNDLRNFTTPEMFASLQLDLLERGASAQHTDVLNVQCQVLDVADEGGQQVVSVRFQGQVREEAGAAPVDFNEIWHLVKPADDSRAWAIAGIEQSH